MKKLLKRKNEIKTESKLVVIGKNNRGDFLEKFSSFSYDDLEDMYEHHLNNRKKK